MAKILEEVVIIKISTMVKDITAQAGQTSMLTDEVMSSLEAVAQELLGDNVIVEVEQA